MNQMKLQRMKNNIEINDTINIRLDTIKNVKGELKKIHKRQWNQI